MVPLQVVFALIVGIWGLIGLVRGFSKEAGATLAIVIAMEALNLLGTRIIDGINRIAKIGARGQAQAVVIQAEGTTRFWFYVIVFVFITLIGYQGETLGLSGNVGRVKENVLGVLIGLINGYLVAGNLWYFLDTYAKYNVPGLGIQAPTAQAAQQIIHFLPYNLLREPMLMGLLLLFLVLRIAK